MTPGVEGKVPEAAQLTVQTITYFFTKVKSRLPAVTFFLFLFLYEVRVFILVKTKFPKLHSRTENECL